MILWFSALIVSKYIYLGIGITAASVTLVITTIAVVVIIVIAIGIYRRVIIISKSEESSAHTTPGQ